MALSGRWELEGTHHRQRYQESITIFHFCSLEARLRLVGIYWLWDSGAQES